MFGRSDITKAGIKKQAFKGFIYLVLFIIAINLITLLASYVSSRYACHTQWVESGIDYKYTLRGGCLLNRNGGWIPAANYRVE